MLSGGLRELTRRGKVQLGNPKKCSWTLTEAIANKNFSLQSSSNSSNKISQMWSLLEVVTFESCRKENFDCIRILDCITTDVD